MTCVDLVGIVHARWTRQGVWGDVLWTLCEATDVDRTYNQKELTLAPGRSVTCLWCVVADAAKSVLL